MTKDNWIKAFENTRLVKMGGMCFECCDYEDMVDDMKAFISQVEKDAIEKTNKGWIDILFTKLCSNPEPHFPGSLPCCSGLSISPEKLSDLLEDK